METVFVHMEMVCILFAHLETVCTVCTVCLYCLYCLCVLFDDGNGFVRA